MEIRPVPDNDKIALADAVGPVIQRHEGTFLGAAFADAACQYGEWRQAGLDHAHALWQIHGLLLTWWGDTFDMPEPPAPPAYRVAGRDRVFEEVLLGPGDPLY